MKTIFRIAKTELRVLFFSPIAWFLVVVFMIQSAGVYLTVLEHIVVRQDMGGPGLKYLSKITEIIYASPGGFFKGLLQNLYLYIPLLTMGLISRETSSGTIRLLYSSPISVREIVLGKFMGIMIFCLVLISVAGIFMISGLLHIKATDTSLLFAGVLGFFLLLAAYSAIGLFMSSLTGYQVVAAICTFVMIGILRYIGSVWQQYDLARDFTYFLSISGRAEKILAGLVSTKDLVYFLLIVWLFLSFTVFRLRAVTESKPAIVHIRRYMLTIIAVLAIGYITSLPALTVYADLTASKSRTLTPQTQQILHDFGDAPLEITAYNNLLGNYSSLGMPERRNETISLWEDYLRFKPDIQLKFVQYYDSTLDNEYQMKAYPGKTVKQIAEQFAKSRRLKLAAFKTPEQIRKEIDLRPELNRFVMRLKWKDRTTWLRVFDDQLVWPSETEVAAAFKRLQQAQLPKVAFLTGELERSVGSIGDRDYKVLTSLQTFRNALINQGFQVDTVSLESQQIPADIATLVVADPRIPFTPATLAKLQQYMRQGGNMLIAGEAGRQGILNPLLQELGIQMQEGQLVQQSKDFSPDLVTPQMTALAGSFTRRLGMSREDSLPISMPGAVALSYADTGAYTIRPLLTTDSTLSWNKKEKLDLENITTASASSAGASPVVGTVSFSPAAGDIKAAFATALCATRQVGKREQRIIVAGDADFMGNSELRRYAPRVANFEFNTALFSWLSYGAYPIDTYRPPGKDNRVTVTPDDMDYLRILYQWVFPGLVLIAAAILLIRRKRK